MNKQTTVNNTDSSGNVLEAGSATKSNLPSTTLPRKYKLVLIVASVIIAVAVCAAIAVAVGTSYKINTSQRSENGINYDEDLLDAEMEESQQLLVDEADFKTVAKRQTSTGQSGCWSNKSDETYPAARIAGKGFKWTTDEPGNKNTRIEPGYQTVWVCANQSGAFVDGGMHFSLKEKKLTVPYCGYYQVSSHVFFQSDRTDSISTSKYVRHEVIINKNCNYDHESDTVILRSYSSLVSTPTRYGRTSTHIGDVVKMCKYGTITVNIPKESNPCCPYGRSQSTYLSAYMVTNTSCNASIPSNHPLN